MGKAIWGAVILAGVVGGFFLWQNHVDRANRQGQQGRPPSVVTDLTASRTTAPMPLEYVGRLAGAKEVQLRARVAGTLLRRTYTEGQFVKAGDLMFVIDPEPHRAALAQQQAVLQQAQVQQSRAKIERDRILALHARGAVSDADRDDALTAYASASASVETASALVKQSRINLQWTEVRAPISGITGQETRSEGNLVTLDPTGSLLTTIVQLNPLTIDFAIPADELRRNEMLQSQGILTQDTKNASVQVVLPDGTAFASLGRINFADRVADPQTGAIRMRARVQNPKGTLLPGQFVRVRVLGSSLKDAILIPQRAVMTTQDGHRVYVLNTENIPTLRPVEVALSLGNDHLISKGLEAGERIVLDGVLKVIEGMGVQIAPRASQEKEPVSVDETGE